MNVSVEKIKTAVISVVFCAYLIIAE